MHLLLWMVQIPNAIVIIRKVNHNWLMSFLSYQVAYMSTTVKLDETGKKHLEKLQAKLRLVCDIKIDQFRLLRSLVYFGEENFEGFLSFLQGTELSEEEIQKLKTSLIKPYSHHYPEKSDDELLYEESS